LAFLNEMVEGIESMSGERKLFILHYAGHAVAHPKGDGLILTARIAQELNARTQFNMNLIRDHLRVVVQTAEGLDILILLDCCCAAVAGRGAGSKGARMELMAATSGGGISNSRKDGKTFTQNWVEAFNELIEIGEAFNSDSIQNIISRSYNLPQYPATFILREGWGVPITFRARPTSVTTPAVSEFCSKIIIAALYLVDDPDSQAMKNLIDYLQKAPVNISVLAALRVSSTFLLLRVPIYLQEVLALPQVTYILSG